MSHRADKPLYLFFDLPEWERNLLLKKTQARMPLMDKVTKSKVAAIDRDERLARTPKRSFASAPNLMEDFLTEYAGGIILDDGWYRLVVRNKLGNLEIFNGQRFESPDLAYASKVAICTKEMMKWPTIKVRPAKGFMKKKLIHWRTAGTAKAHLVLIRESEDRNFYFDWPEEVKGVPGGRTHFQRRFSPSDRGIGWFKINLENMSRHPFTEQPQEEPVVTKLNIRVPKKAKFEPKARTHCSKCQRSIFEHPSKMCLPCRS